MADGARRVLVVSDDLDAGRFLARLLADTGFDAISCSTDECPLELASAFPPFDGVLGDAIGPDVVVRVRNLADRRRAATPIVVLGPDRGTQSAESAPDALLAGATSVVARPIDDTDLIAAVSSVLAQNSGNGGDDDG